MKRGTVFLGTQGLNVFVDPVRTVTEPDAVSLSSCMNIEIDNTGRVSRRKGYSSWLSGSWHSLFACSDYLLGVTGDALSVVDGQGYSPIRNVTEGLRVSYAALWDGQKEVVYYANGAETGKVYGRASYPVDSPEPVGPDTSRVFSSMPVGTKLCVWNGRLFVADGKTVWYSEPFHYEAFDLARGFMLFDSEVEMMLPTDAGILVGMRKAIVFLGGNDPSEFQFTRVAGYGVISGTEAQYGNTVSIGDVPTQRPWFFGSREGVCVLTQNGQVLNITENRVPYPDALRGSGGFCGGKYVLNLEG